MCCLKKLFKKSKASAPEQTPNQAPKEEEKVPEKKMTKFDLLVDKVVDSPDKKPMTGSWVGIIIHHTTIGDRDPDEVTPSKWKQLFDGITNWLSTADSSYVSAHFHVGREGELAMLVDPRTHIAYHAGKSSWFHPIIRKVVPSWNQYAIGIEILGDGNKGAYSEAQYDKVAKLCRDLMYDFPTIDPRCITGHENIAPGRKVDPGKHFDWRKLFRMMYETKL